MASEVGRNIDWAAIDPSVAQYLRSQGFAPGSTPSARDQKDLAVLGLLEKPKAKQRGRGETQLEQDFAWFLSSKPVKVWTKPMVLRIGPDTTFEPDFLVYDPRSEDTFIVDTKGPWTDGDSRLKAKITAEKFFMWRMLIVTRPGGHWVAKEVDSVKGIGRKYIELDWLK